MSKSQPRVRRPDLPDLRPLESPAAGCCPRPLLATLDRPADRGRPSRLVRRRLHLSRRSEPVPERLRPVPAPGRAGRAHLARALGASRASPRHETLAQDVEARVPEEASLGERLADQIADFGGSWTFILLFGGVILVWVLINTIVLLGRAFDPYPFILLNLFLSCLAALQAPVIMMSQNRQEARDRLRSENDYRVNLKAELEIRQLHEKLDHLLQHQWQRLMEIQQIQIELMNEIAPGRRGGG